MNALEIQRWFAGNLLLNSVRVGVRESGRRLGDESRYLHLPLSEDLFSSTFKER